MCGADTPFDFAQGKPVRELRAPPENLVERIGDPVRLRSVRN
jgi:hypothetical protein